MLLFTHRLIPFCYIAAGKKTSGFFMKCKLCKEYLLSQLQKIATPEALLAKMNYAPLLLA
jgi:hypothetical protein